MKRLILACMTAFAVGLLAAAPGAAQTETTPPLEPIYWELVPGALNWTADQGLTLTVGCRATSDEPTWGNRNSFVHLHLKVFERRGSGWVNIYATRDGAVDPTDTAKKCNLRLGIDTVHFTSILLPGDILNDPEKIEDLRWMARFYRPHRFPRMGHAGLHLTNNQVLKGVTNNFHDGPTPAAEAAVADDF